MNKEFFQHMHERDQAEIPVDQALKKRVWRELGVGGSSVSWFGRIWRAVRSVARPLGGFVLAGGLVAVLAISLSPQAHQEEDWRYGSGQSETEASLFMKTVPQHAVSALSAPAPQPQAFQRAANDAFAPAGSAAGLAAPSMAYEAADTAIGFAVGGSKNIANFRENIRNGLLPQENDVTYEGLFYDYSFDTGSREACRELFCPSYARAVSRNPVTGQDETYLAVGLNSNLKASDVVRPKTNFVVVLDISGSMDSAFDQSYYDRSGKRMELSAQELKKTKMQVANESLAALVDHLRPDDRLGIVVFSDTASVAKPLRLMRETDRASLKNHILALRATNGTNMSAGLEAGARLFPNDHVAEQTFDDGYVNRMIFITDAMPNEGEFGAGGLKSLAERYVADHVQTTFIGVGLDFQTDLVQSLTQVRGANYLSIHTPQDFKAHLSDDFDLLVNPLVYDLRLQVQGGGYAIEEIYGSPDADRSSGEVMHVRTLFPSKTKNGETRGGLVLLKLRKTGDSGDLVARVSYQNTKGQAFTNESRVDFRGVSSGSFDNNGVRKGVLLVQYATLLRDWLRFERGESGWRNNHRGNTWERNSETLHVSGVYPYKFQQFSEFLKREISAIGDRTLDQEQTIVDRLVQLAGHYVDDPLQAQPYLQKPAQPLQDEWQYKP